MPLTKVQLKPGIVKEVTSYVNEGGWVDCDKVRFRYGFPEKIGGWVPFSSSTALGTIRAIKSFVTLDGTFLHGVGTNQKYYIESGGGFNDITPIRSITAAGDATFSASNGSSIVTVFDNAHGAILGDFVEFADAVSLGGQIGEAVLNQEHQIVEIVSDNTYRIDPGVVADASDSGNGGSLTVATYQINSGLDTSVSGTGFGAGSWSRGRWGSASELLAVGDILRLWSHDNFGEDLILNVRDGGIYYWDRSASAASYQRAVELASRPFADFTTPTIAKQVLVSDRDRHIIAFGCDAENNIGVQDPLLIRFSDQENPNVWQSLPTNTAGDLRIGSGSQIVCAVETRQQVLVFTDVSLHAMQFLGPPFTFGIQIISENTTIIAPNAYAAVDDLVFWMGEENFYAYSGQVKDLPCAVKQYVFSDLNRAQKEKIFAALNSSFNEVWWFYPSGDATEIDRYVVYDYGQQVWTVGSLERTAWVDRGVYDFPIGASTDGKLYFHEIGVDDGQNDTGIHSYIESSQIDIGEGDQFTFIRRLIPDISFTGTDSTIANNPTVDFVLKTRRFPGEDYSTVTSSDVERTTTLPIEQFTRQVHVRLRGRSMALRVESADQGVQWKLGAPRVDIRPDGRR